MIYRGSTRSCTKLQSSRLPDVQRPAIGSPKSGVSRPGPGPIADGSPSSASDPWESASRIAAAGRLSMSSAWTAIPSRWNGSGTSGGNGAASPAEAAAGADAVVAVVVNAYQTREILFGAGGAVSAMAPSSVVISCATMSPNDCPGDCRGSGQPGTAVSRRARSAAAPSGRSKASFRVLASGSPDAFAKAEPVLQAMSQTVYRLGDRPGIGAAFKVVNQLLAAFTSRSPARRSPLPGGRISIWSRSTRSSAARRAIPGCSRIACRIFSRPITARGAPSTSSPRTSASSVDMSEDL